MLLFLFPAIRRSFACNTVSLVCSLSLCARSLLLFPPLFLLALGTSASTEALDRANDIILEKYYDSRIVPYIVERSATQMLDILKVSGVRGMCVSWRRREALCRVLTRATLAMLAYDEGDKTLVCAASSSTHTLSVFPLAPVLTLLAISRVRCTVFHSPAQLHADDLCFT